LPPWFSWNDDVPNQHLRVLPVFENAANAWFGMNHFDGIVTRKACAISTSCAGQDLFLQDWGQFLSNLDHIVVLNKSGFFRISDVDHRFDRTDAFYLEASEYREMDVWEESTKSR
jgi:hypothetical protein